jgi:hypothetical protein
MPEGGGSSHIRLTVVRGAGTRLLAQPVDARQRLEVHQDDVAAKLGGAEWLRVEPPGRTGERGQMHTFEHGDR